MKTHYQIAGEIYAEIKAMVDNMARNDVASEREKIADAIKCRMSDYSWHRYAAGQREQRPNT